MIKKTTLMLIFISLMAMAFGATSHPIGNESDLDTVSGYVEIFTENGSIIRGEYIAHNSEDLWLWTGCQESLISFKDVAHIEEVPFFYCVCQYIDNREEDEEDDLLRDIQELLDLYSSERDNNENNGNNGNNNNGNNDSDNDKENCNAGRGNDSEEDEDGEDCDPGNSGENNQGGD